MSDTLKDMMDSTMGKIKSMVDVNSVVGDPIRISDDVVIVDSFFRQSPHHANPLWFLAKSLELLSTADAAYFADHWDEHRGCKIEHDACKYYNIKILHD